MTVWDLLELINNPSAIIQIVTEDWDTYNTFPANSNFIDLIINKKIKRMGAIADEVYRIEIDWG